MTAGPADRVIGWDELGNPVFSTITGTQYGRAYAAPQERQEQPDVSRIQGRGARSKASRDAFL